MFSETQIAWPELIDNSGGNTLLEVLQTKVPASKYSTKIIMLS